MKKAIVLMLCVVVLCSGCSPFGWMAGLFKTTPDGTKSEKKKSEERLVIKEPIVIGKNSRGGDIVRTKTIDHYKYSNESVVEKPERTRWQRFLDRLESLGWKIVLGIIAAIVVTQGAAVGWIASWALKTFRTLRGVVKGIKQSGAIVEGNPLHNAIKSNLQDVSGADVLVKKIKTKIQDL